MDAPVDHHAEHPGRVEIHSGTKIVVEIVDELLDQPGPIEEDGQVELLLRENEIGPGRRPAQVNRRQSGKAVDSGSSPLV